MKTCLAHDLLLGALAVGLIMGPALGPRMTIVGYDLLRETFQPWAQGNTDPDFQDHFNADQVQEFLPYMHLHQQRLQQGEFPLWNPFNLGGEAYTDNPVRLPFHPLRWLLLWLPPHQVMDWTAVFHFLIAWWSMAYYLRHREMGFPARFVGALGWCFSSVFVCNYPHERFIAFPALLPAAVALLERIMSRPRWMDLIALSLLMGGGMLLAGPTGLLVAGITLSVRLTGLLLFERCTGSARSWGMLAGSVCLSLLLGAVALAPLLHGMLVSVREFDYASRFTGSFSMVHWLIGVPMLLVAGIHPWLAGTRDTLDALKAAGFSVTFIPFVGGFSTLLAAVQFPRLIRRRDLAWLFLLIGAGLALLTPPCYRLLNTRAVLLLCLPLAVLGACAVQAIADSGGEDRRRLAMAMTVLLAVSAAGLVALTIGLWLFHDRIHAVLTAKVEQGIPLSLLRDFPAWQLARVDRFLALLRLSHPAHWVWLGGFSLVVGGLWRLARRESAWAWAGLTAGLALPGLYYAHTEIFLIDTERFPPLDPRPAWREALPERDQGRPPRVWVHQAGAESMLFRANLNRVFTFGRVRGRGSLYGPNPSMLVHELPPDHQLVRCLGVNWAVVSAATQAPIPGYAQWVYDGDLRLARRDDPFPPACVSYRIAPAADWRQAIRQARAETAGADQRRRFVEGPLPGWPRNGAPPPGEGAATITRYHPERVELDVATSAPGLLILSDTWYPGWEVTVDGDARRLVRVDGCLRGVFIEPGDRSVVFRYRPRWVYAGVAGSTAGAALLAVITIAAAKRNRARAAAG